MVNTLYVDKNLEYHGLLQAFSRTNRVLNERKRFGKIVCFRDLKSNVDKAIKLFSNNQPDEFIIRPPFEQTKKELNDLKKVTSGADDYKTKYEKEHSDFEAYKKDIQKKEVLAEKKKLYRAALKAANVDEKRYEAILKVTDLEGLKIKDGKFEDEAGVKKAITDNWSDFVVKSKTEQSDDPANPPANNGNGGNPVSRAAQLAQQYSANLYGAPKTDK